jgi:hypothetical protein
MYEFFISGIFHFIFSDHGGPGVTENTKSKLRREINIYPIGSVSLENSD